MFDEEIQETFQYNKDEILYLTNKRGIVIGEKFVTPEETSLPAGIPSISSVPGMDLVNKVKSFLGGKELPLLYIDAFPILPINQMQLEENPLKKQSLLDVVKEKTKEKFKNKNRKGEYSHKLKIYGREFNVEEKFLPEVWLTSNTWQKN